MNDLRKEQCISIEKMLILSLNEVLEILEYTKMDVIDRNMSYGRAKKVANKYTPVMLRNSNRLREFRLFMKEYGLQPCDKDLTERVDCMIKFYC